MGGAVPAQPVRPADVVLAKPRLSLSVRSSCGRAVLLLAGVAALSLVDLGALVHSDRVPAAPTSEDRPLFSPKDIGPSQEASDAPRSGTPPSRATTPAAPPKPHVPLLVSVVVSEPRRYLEPFLANLLTFTDSSTRFSVHLSRTAQYSESDLAWLGSIRRISITPTRTRAAPLRGGTAAAHLINVDHAARLYDFDHVMFWSSSAWFIRPGVEAHVQNHSASLFLMPSLRGRASARFPHRHVDASRYRSSPPRGGFGERQFVIRMLRSSTVQSLLETPSISTLEPGTRLPPYVFTQMRHEGSFYPGAVMRHLALSASGIARAVGEMEALHVPLEEFLFPTWAARRMRVGNAGVGDGASANIVAVVYDDAAIADRGIPVEDKTVTKEMVARWRLSTRPPAFGIKAVATTATDHHGTRAYLESLAMNASRSRWAAARRALGLPGHY